MATAPLDRALTRVGDRWTLLLVEALLDGPLRYGELADAVTGIAPNILAARLKRLEQDGLVTATPYSRAAAAPPVRPHRRRAGAGRGAGRAGGVGGAGRGPPGAALPRHVRHGPREPAVVPHVQPGRRRRRSRRPRPGLMWRHAAPTAQSAAACAVRAQARPTRWHEAAWDTLPRTGWARMARRWVRPRAGAGVAGRAAPDRSCRVRA